MSETQLLQEELDQLPLERRESWAGWFHHELAELREHDEWFESRSADQLRELRALIREGVESGDAGTLDVDEIIREARHQREERATGG